MCELEIVQKPYAEWTKEHPLEVGIAKMSITYTQEQDNNSPIPNDVEDQTITIEAVGADMADRDGIEKRENYYYTISTNRWAITNPKEIYMLLQDFEDRLYHNTENINE